MAQAEHRVFMSYARNDADFASRLVRDLASHNVSVWMDQADIVPGERWDRAVQQALEEATDVLVILSPASCASENVMDEVSFALSNGKRVVPALVVACDIPFRLARLQWVDLTGDYSAGVEQLVEALGQRPVKTGRPPVERSPVNPPAGGPAIAVHNLHGHNVVVAERIREVRFGNGGTVPNGEE